MFTFSGNVRSAAWKGDFVHRMHVHGVCAGRVAISLETRARTSVPEQKVENERSSPVEPFA